MNSSVTVSVVGRCGHPRRLANRDDGHACTWCAAHGQAQGDRQEASFGRSTWLGVCDLLRQNGYAPHSLTPSRQAEIFNPGTLTRNEQTVTELYTVDELVNVDPAAPAPPAHVSPAMCKTLEVGALCNDASTARNEDGNYVGQATDVALLNVLSVFGLPDPRQVSNL